MFDVTMGGADSNAYSSPQLAQEWFDLRLNSESWSSATQTNQECALVMATSQLDRLQFVGEPTTKTQRLSWPRQFVPVPDPSGIYWGQELRLREHYEDSNSIPNRIVEALYEITLLILTDNSLIEDTSLRQFKDLTVPGVVSLTINPNALPRLFNKNVKGLIDPYVKAKGFSVPIQRAH